MGLHNKLKFLFDISIRKTIRVNFGSLKFKEAIKLPVFISRKVKLRSIKGKIAFGCGVSRGMVRIGFDTLNHVDYSRERSVFCNDGLIVFHGFAAFGAASKLIIENGVLSVGNNVNMTGKSIIIVKQGVKIGDNSLVSWDVQIMDTDYHHLLTSDGDIRPNTEKIMIGNHVWIGSRATILKGSEIADNSVVAAGAVVRGKCEVANSIYAGQPARLVKRDIDWKQ